MTSSADADDLIRTALSELEQAELRLAEARWALLVAAGMTITFHHEDMTAVITPDGNRWRWRITRGKEVIGEGRNNSEAEARHQAESRMKSPRWQSGR